MRRIFLLASAAPADHRESLLDRECRGDADLRQRVVGLIAAAQDSSLVTAPTLEAPPSDDASPTRYPHSLAGEPLAASLREGPGSTIGPYKLLEVIGEGGFGTVFLAEQEKPVARKVALKIIKLGMDTRQIIARFEAERQALALMDHHNIARVLDAGATDTGRPFFVMELVKGDPITEYCDRNNLPIRDRLDLFAQVCQAVQHAHQKGIIHRDIKPSNVLVSTQDDRPFAKVIDFGIAKATASNLTERTLFTEHRQLIGTPEYMSPEQAEGDLDIDTRTDIYSLGVLLYELLTGTTPFAGTALRSAAYGEVQRIIREVDPPRPSTRLSESSDKLAGIAANRRSEPRKLGSTIRGELDWIVMKALEKDRQRRYETPNGLAVDIRRYLTGEAVAAAPPSSAYLLSKFVRRHKGTVVATGLIGAALVLGIVGFGWQAAIAGRERDRAKAAEAEASQRAGELLKVSEFQAKMLSQIEPSDAGQKLMSDIRAKFAAALEKSGVPEAERAAQTAAFAKHLGLVNATDSALQLIDETILKPAIKAIDAQFKAQPVVDASLRATIGALYESLGLYKDALALQQEAVAIRRRVLGDTHKDTLTSINELGTAYEMLANMPEAEKYYLESYEGRRRTLGEDSPATLASMGNLGNVYRVQAKFAQAEPLLRDTLERRRRVVGNEDRDTLIAMNTMGFLYVTQGKLAEVEPLWREAYETGSRVFKEDDTDLFVWASNLASLLQAQGKLEEAGAIFETLLEKNRRVRGDEHPNTIQALGIVAGNLMRRSKLAEAEPLLRESYEKSLRLRGPEHPGTLKQMGELGVLLMQRGMLAEAAPYLRQTWETRHRVQGVEHPETLIARGQLARLIWSQGNLAEAEAMYRELLETDRRVFGPERPDTLATFVNLGSVLIQSDKLDEAEPMVREALEIRRRVSGEEDTETLIALTNLGMVLENRGKSAEAEAIYRGIMEKYRRKLGNDSLNTLNNIATLAGLLRTQGNPAEAEPLFREAVAGLERKYGKDHFRTAGARTGLGKTLIDLSQFAAAEQELIEAERAYSTAQGVAPKARKKNIESLATLYETWHKAEPGKGHDVKAAEWKGKVEAMNATAPQKTESK